jgi:hypothetical protein
VIKNPDITKKVRTPSEVNVAQKVGQGSGKRGKPAVAMRCENRTRQIQSARIPSSEGSRGESGAIRRHRIQLRSSYHQSPTVRARFCDSESCVDHSIRRDRRVGNSIAARAFLGSIPSGLSSALNRTHVNRPPSTVDQTAAVQDDNYVGNYVGGEATTMQPLFRRRNHRSEAATDPKK